MIRVNDIEIKPTIFPDKTSQIWKLPEDLLDQLHKDYIITVSWDFENETEFLWLAQLKTLLDQYSPVVHLDMPYLPYGRQDKIVRNDKTFALTTFAKLLNSLKFTQVQVIDAHNNPRANMIENLVDVSPKLNILEAVNEATADCILFPDEGASRRYACYFNDNVCVHAQKVRDQSTGKITSIKISGSVLARKVIMVDDLCDGGATFTMLAEQAYKDGAHSVHLYVSHGIFSKGKKVLRDAGIKRIFTYKGEEK